MSGINLTQGRGKVKGALGWVGNGYSVRMRCRDARGSEGSGARC